MIQRMCKKTDRLIHITEEDTVILMTPPVPGTEKMAARTLDILYRSDAQVQMINKRLLTSAHATAEELKMMIEIQLVNLQVAILVFHVMIKIIIFYIIIKI